MSKYLLLPERQQDETQEQYRQRQRDAKEYAKMLKRGVYPTAFVQHRPNLNNKWRLVDEEEIGEGYTL